MSGKSRVFSSISPYPDKGARLTLELNEDDALLVYQLLNGYRLYDGRGERLSWLIEDNYEETFDSRLTEPWEWT